MITFAAAGTMMDGECVMYNPDSSSFVSHWHEAQLLDFALHSQPDSDYQIQQVDQRSNDGNRSGTTHKVHSVKESISWGDLEGWTLSKLTVVCLAASNSESWFRTSHSGCRLRSPGTRWTPSDSATIAASRGCCFKRRREKRQSDQLQST